MKEKGLQLTTNSQRFKRIFSVVKLSENEESSSMILPFAFIPFPLFRRMLDLNKKLHCANLAFEKTMIQRQIGATKWQIDRLVYEL